MKKSWLTVILTVACLSLVQAQVTQQSRDNYIGIWTDPASWVIGTPPPASINTAQLDLVINGYIHREGSLTLKANNSTKNFTVNDTLVIRGDLILEQNAPRLNIGPNAILIIIGNVSTLNSIVIDNGGIFIVTGNMAFHNGNSDFYNNTGGELFVGGTISQNPDASGDDEWDELGNRYPKLKDFIDCGGFFSCQLPVKITSFNLEVEGSVVNLSWVTTMEENFRNFVIQRSADGLTFEDIGSVDGRGFNIYDIETKYRFTDISPMLGTNYYRLKAVDMDDSFEVFDVKMIRVEGVKDVAVYPNPSTGEELSFQLNFNPDESDFVVLVDQLGTEVFSGSVVSIDNRIVFREQLRPGIYVLKYQSKKSEFVKKILVRQ